MLDHVKAINVCVLCVYYYFAPKADPGVCLALLYGSGDEGLVIAHVHTGQVSSLRHTRRLCLLPVLGLGHQLVAVLVPGDIARGAGAMRRWGSWKVAV